MGLVRPFTSTSATAPYPRTTARCGHRDRRQGGPTATEREFARRRGPRAHHEQGCKCQRHRGRARRQRWGRKPRRKKGDKNKNGRRATLVVMYTLRQGEDGRLHGPVNGQQEGVRDIRLAEVGRWDGPGDSAPRRGLPPELPRWSRSSSTARRAWSSDCGGCSVGAILTLDVRHAQETLWEVGR